MANNTKKDLWEAEQQQKRQQNNGQGANGPDQKTKKSGVPKLGRDQDVFKADELRTCTVAEKFFVKDGEKLLPASHDDVVECDRAVNGILTRSGELWRAFYHVDSIGEDGTLGIGRRLSAFSEAEMAEYLDSQPGQTMVKVPFLPSAQSNLTDAEMAAILAEHGYAVTPPTPATTGPGAPAHPQTPPASPTPGPAAPAAFDMNDPAVRAAFDVWAMDLITRPEDNPYLDQIEQVIEARKASATSGSGS